MLPQWSAARIGRHGDNTARSAERKGNEYAGSDGLGPPLVRDLSWLIRSTQGGKGEAMLDLNCAGLVPKPGYVHAKSSSACHTGERSEARHQSLVSKRLHSSGLLRRELHLLDGQQSGELRACRIIRAEMRDPYGWNWFCIQIDDDDSQLIALEACERHFGGWQWYFVCPRTGLKASVLWMPPGARSFASRKRWGRQVAYHSQFLSEIDRAHRGKEPDQPPALLGRLFRSVRMGVPAKAQMDAMADLPSRRGEVRPV